MISTMKKMMFQTGLNERVPVPPEKRFLIHFLNCSGPEKTQS